MERFRTNAETNEPSHEDGSGDTRVSRRETLRTGAVGVVGLTVGGSALATLSVASASSDAYNGYLSDERTWKGETVDASGEELVHVGVGTPGNGGDFAFAPVVVYIEPDTAIEWEWTGNGGGHNVVHDPDGDPERDEVVFDSGEETLFPTPSEEGETYERTFQEEGVYPYVCTPHDQQEMKGVVVVGEENVETDLIPLAEYEIPEDTDGFAPGFGIGGALAGLGTLGYLLRNRMKKSGRSEP